MGLIISGFKHTRMLDEDLEALDFNIKFTENEEQCIKRNQKKVLKSMDLSLFLMVLFFFVLYTVLGLGGEETWGGSAFHATLIVIGLVIFGLLIRQVVATFYKRKLEDVQTKIKSMKIDKQNILEEVKTTENYRVAKQLLDRYESD